MSIDKAPNSPTPEPSREEETQRLYNAFLARFSDVQLNVQYEGRPSEFKRLVESAMSEVKANQFLLPEDRYRLMYLLVESITTGNGDSVGSQLSAYASEDPELGWLPDKAILKALFGVENAE